MINSKKLLKYKRAAISQSDFRDGIRCLKLLWMRRNTKNITDTGGELFDQRLHVKKMAISLFPGGLKVRAMFDNIEEILRTTSRFLRRRLPLFGAGFIFEKSFAYVDILNPVGQNEWEVYNVKSVTKLKEIFITECAFRTYIAQRNGLKIVRSFLIHLNPEYIRNGSLDPHELLEFEDITKLVSKRVRSVREQLKKMVFALRQTAPPKIPIGHHCDLPDKCLFKSECWKHLPKRNVTVLYKGKSKGFDLLNDGIYLLKDIPENFSLSERQSIQRRTAFSGRLHFNPPALKEFLSRIEYPAYFVDFETYSLPLAPFEGLKPYQRVPFQFSVQILNAKAGPAISISFLEKRPIDPRMRFMKKLTDSIGDKGSVIVYNKSFEIGVLRECASSFPEFSSWVVSIEKRTVDLLEPFRSFHYYHPDQAGSASIKSILPALTGQSYDTLEIQDGQTASLGYLRVTFGKTDETERQRVYRQLLKYCGLDTLGMVNIVGALKKMTQIQQK